MGTLIQAAAQHVTAALPDPRRALAQRLEAVHGWCIAQYAASLQRLRPQVGAGVMDLAGAHAIYTGPSPFSFTVGLGMQGPVSADELDQIQDYFTSRGHATRVDVTPYSDPSLRELIWGRGYRVSEVTAVLVRNLETELPAITWPEGVSVRWAAPHECDLWVDVVAKCFFVRDPGPARRANISALFLAPNSLNVLAMCNRALAGVAGGMIPDDREIAPLFASATLPPFRRRGIHGAMLQMRLERAKLEGCKLAMITATPGSESERNLQRHGFVPCYEKVTYVKVIE